MEGDFFTSLSTQCSLIILVCLLCFGGVLCFVFIFFLNLVEVYGFVLCNLLLDPCKVTFFRNVRGCGLFVTAMIPTDPLVPTQHHGSASQLSTCSCSLEITQIICLVSNIKAQKSPFK